MASTFQVFAADLDDVVCAVNSPVDGRLHEPRVVLFAGVFDLDFKLLYICCSRTRRSNVVHVYIQVLYVSRCWTRCSRSWTVKAQQSVDIALLGIALCNVLIVMLFRTCARNVHKCEIRKEMWACITCYDGSYDLRSLMLVVALRCVTIIRAGPVATDKGPNEGRSLQKATQRGTILTLKLPAQEFGYPVGLRGRSATQSLARAHAHLSRSNLRPTVSPGQYQLRVAVGFRRMKQSSRLDHPVQIQRQSEPSFATGRIWHTQRGNCCVALRVCNAHVGFQPRYD